MTIEEMIKTLGVKTQSEDDISLCIKMDLEAFHMMRNDKYSYEKEINDFTNIFKYLMSELYGHALSQKEKAEILESLKTVNYNDEDSAFRNIYFHGLERTLLRFGHHEMILINPDRDARHKVAYIYELNKDYDKAIALYEHLGDSDRVLICKAKQRNM